MDGVLVVDKPEGLTSHDVVAIARRALGEKRIGHTGTLDPIATGVLPLACGRATRLVRFLSASDKDYDAIIRFGVTTDSFDITGEETSRTGLVPTREALDAAVASLRGEYLQLPPAFSAKKVGGRRAYDLARSDQPVALTAVPVQVTRAEVTSFSGERATISLTCSAGFYVRSFAHELGIRVNVGACLEALRRTRSGDFHLTEALTIDALHEGVADVDLIPIERLLPGFPAVTVTDEGLTRVSHGRELQRGHYKANPPGAGVPPNDSGTARAAEPAPWTRIFDSTGRLAALGSPGTAPGSLHPAIVLT